MEGHTTATIINIIPPKFKIPIAEDSTRINNKSGRAWYHSIHRPHIQGAEYFPKRFPKNLPDVALNMTRPAARSSQKYIPVSQLIRIIANRTPQKNENLQRNQRTYTDQIPRSQPKIMATLPEINPISNDLCPPYKIPANTSLPSTSVPKRCQPTPRVYESGGNRDPTLVSRVSAFIFTIRGSIPCPHKEGVKKCNPSSHLCTRSYGPANT